SRMWPTALFSRPAGELWPGALSTATTTRGRTPRTWTLEDGLSANHAALRTPSRPCLHGAASHRAATLSLPLWHCHGPRLLLSLDRRLIYRTRASLRRNHAALRNDWLL